MAYGGRAETEQIDLPSGYWVRMKTKATRGDRLAAQEAMLKIRTVGLQGLSPEDREEVAVDPEDPTAQRGMLTKYHTKAYFDTWMMRLIVEWNLDDEAGNILPITVATLDGLEQEDDDVLQAAAKKRMKKPVADPPSGRRSGASFPDTRSPMPEPNAL